MHAGSLLCPRFFALYRQVTRHQSLRGAFDPAAFRPDDINAAFRDLKL